MWQESAEDSGPANKVILLRDMAEPCPEGDTRRHYWEMPDGSPALESTVRVVREVTREETSIVETFYEVMVPSGVYLTRIAECEHLKQLDGRMFVR